MLDRQGLKRAERALRFSTLEGMAYGAVQGAGEHFTAAYAVALGASNYSIALLSAVPTLLASVALAGASRMVALLGSRKRVVILFAALSGVMWLPILGLGFLPSSIPRPLWLIALVGLYTVLNSMTSPTWSSIMAEVVPDKLRGSYFGHRSRWGTLANMTTFLLAGGLLFLFRDRGLLGFALIFGAAFVFRMVSVTLLTTLLEMPHSKTAEKRPSLGSFLRELPSTTLGRVILYLSVVNMVVNLAGPFFAPYMLKELHLNYLTYTALEMCSTLAGLLTVTHWGAAADRTGNRRMLTIAGVMIGFVPLLWLVSGQVVYLGFAQFYSGFAWAGFNLVSINLLYDATNPSNRTAYFAYYGTMTGIASFLGALVGGLVISHVPRLMGSAILTMFLLSGVLRLLAAVAFLPYIHEVRRVRTIPATELFHIMLGGRVVHRPAHNGRTHHHLHGQREPEERDKEAKADS